ncbi:hypothetical protein Pfo_031328 [Paulownia fortunei]|nr:hypothetical protein Pfo_031328 [Paulownia fortunei]
MPIDNFLENLKGLYEAELDTEKKLLQNPTLVGELTNPTYLAVSKANKVYAVENRDGQGGVVTFDNSVRPLAEIDAQLSEGSAPAYIGVDEARQLVYAGYYHRDNRLVAVDLGADEVITFDVSDDGKLTEASRFKTEAGFGPRHIRFSPDGQYAYLLGELSSLLSVLKYNSEDGSFEHVQTASTIPTDWTEHNGSAALRLSKDGHYIYASNRGHNSVSVTEGEFPRDMNWDKDEQFLVVANQDTDNVSLYGRDSESGELSLLQKDFAIPEGVRVTFEY